MNAPDSITLRRFMECLRVYAEFGSNASHDALLELFLIQERKADREYPRPPIMGKRPTAACREFLKEIEGERETEE